MNIHFNLFNIILLLGTLQGLILSLMLLFSNKDKRQSKYFLTAFMFVLAYNSFGTFYWSAGLNVPWLAFFDGIFPYTFIFSVGSSFYLYIKTTIEPGKIPPRTIFRAYLPAIIDFAFRILLLVYAIFNKKGISLGVNARSIDAIYQPIAQVLMVMIFWAYLISAILRFRKQSTDMLQTTEASFAMEQSLASKWTKVLLIVMSIIALAWAITIFGSLLFNITGIGYFAPIEIILVIFVYWIGLKAYNHTRVVYVSTQKAVKTYTDSLASKDVEACIGLLKKSMETDKLYLDPTLSVSKLAEKLDLNPKTISAVLNRELEKGFNEFVNKYRINEVKTKMLRPENSHITIAGLAFESGFNSLATFQRAFKSSENITPKEFLSIQKNRG